MFSIQNISKQLDDTSELSYQYYTQISDTRFESFTIHHNFLNISKLFLKNINLFKFIKIFYKRPGNPYLRIRKIFPAINVATRFKISKHVIF